MRVLIFTQYFPPEVGATQTRLELFARWLAESGHEVSVITEIPNHPRGVIFDGWRGRFVDRRNEKGYEVVRVWVATTRRKSWWTRVAFYATYCINAIVAALFAVRRKPDVIFASSPPLPVLISAAVVAAAWRRPFVADIRDIWPAVGIALGEVRGRAAMRLAERVESALYRKAAAITCVTLSFVDHVLARDIDPAKVHHLPNGTVPELFNPARRDPGLRHRLRLGSDFVVGYIGLHGIAQALHCLLDAALILQHCPDVHFLLVGDGPVKDALVEEARRRRLHRVTFHDGVPLEQVASYMNECDAMLVPLRRLPVMSGFTPSKLFDAMACARPVVLMVDGEARTILEASHGGIFVEPEDAAGLASCIQDLKSRPIIERAAMGERGRAYVLRYYVRNNEAQKLETILRDVVERSSSESQLNAASRFPRATRIG